MESMTLARNLDGPRNQISDLPDPFMDRVGIHFGLDLRFMIFMRSLNVRT